ncbi:MAG TPA: type II secretion system protein [Anaerohalosphaeraceae bacterium]|nr:type II secretion system protein [Phycisphaerae bacterium]HOK96146.1 type II secretion system protein [Anaerohalosphaeraceae bacterium]HOL31619.1 type II secretion system protein [Anaerohalosphaeraceae bacterium]HOM77010.1 type II secretion system protein [Anaerohalosphaeraceae bacterium]HPC63585.1 type II secretion system protein [Anaerohalosphaeraceae bacterium]
MKTKKGFTLIELLVVIAIIALLLSIIMPALRKAKEYAKKVICQSNQHQFGVVIATYGTEFNYNFRNYKTAVGLNATQLARSWFWVNGTGDYAHEAEPRAIRFIMNSGLLPDRRVFFCPSMNNLSHDKNYVAGSLVPQNTEVIYRNGQTPLFWGTFVWLWKKEMREDVVSINNLSSGAMMCDMTNEAWTLGAGTNATLQNFMNNIQLKRTFQHGNVLMDDMSVKNPSDKDPELVYWLWNHTKWAGRSY